MMSRESCAAKAAMCEGRASDCLNTVYHVQWLEMAMAWRALAGDTNAGATLSRLMNKGCVAAGR